MDPLFHFPAAYQDARDRFLGAAMQHDAAMQSLNHPRRGPAGEELYLDVVRIGPRNARAKLLVISGTHGAEGYAGSGCQTGLLNDPLLEWLPDDFALVLIHAANPFGMAWMRRANEDNVDLNRNFVDHDRPPPTNPEYLQLVEAVCPKDLSSAALAEADALLEEYRHRLGNRLVQSAVCCGQYEHPEGLFYGGRAEVWSNRAIRDFVESELGESEDVGVIDLHTGLGDFGSVELVSLCDVPEGGFDRAQQWWGASVHSTARGDSVSIPVRGCILSAIEQSLPESTVTGVTLEIGTYPIFDVFSALREENWFFTHDRGDSPEADAARERMRETFYPQAPAWRRGAYRQFRTVFLGAVNGLTGWR